jgi:hypothetical protein
MKKFLLFGVGLGLFALYVQAQPNRELPSPSPQVAALGKYGDVPVSLFSGLPNISVPIHTVVEGDLSLPISLSYHAGGIKVAEAASWVGLGWALNAGGMITRSIQHVPDEGPLTQQFSSPPVFSGPEATLQTGYYRDGYVLPPILDMQMYTQPNWWLNIDNAKTHSLYHQAAVGAVDCEPDLFFFNFAGYSGKFYFKVTKNGN